MKEVIVLSGKGGTGKTSIVACLASLVGKCVIADCDVDTADLHLILAPSIKEKHVFICGKEAAIIQEKCTSCGKCFELCRFGAIKNEGVYLIDPLLCEGCGVCERFCPENAIAMQAAVSGEWYVSDIRMGKFIHARLKPPGENSGKLVTVIRKQARLEAEKSRADFIISDGSPGIGCPVIASVTGADYVLIVTEPTVSGLHDLRRIAELVSHFSLKSGIIINKFNINPEKCREVRAFADSGSIEVLGEIPFDYNFIKAQIAGKALVEYSHGETAKAIKEIVEKICLI